MAIDETELPKGPEGDDSAGALTAFAADDFRLRLDAPLFHRELGMVAAQAPQLRELTWEHVVRPSQQVPNVGDDTAPVLTPPLLTESIESLLENARSSLELSDLVEEQLPEEAHEPVVEEVVVEEVVVEEAADAGLPIYQPATLEKVGALYSLDEDMEVVSTLAAAKPRAETLLAALRQMDEPVVEVAVVEVADVEVADVEVADVEVAVVEVAAPVAVAAELVVPRPSPVSAVEAELNRLAFLPDQDDEPGPVVVPSIAYAEARLNNDVPSLSQHELYAARSSAPATYARPTPVDVPTTFTPVTRRKKKGGFARFATFLVFVAMLGGAAYAGKYYFLDKRWAGDVKALAAEVETARGLTFDHPIAVTSLPASEYTARLVSISFGSTEAELEAESGGWRALGVLDGALDVSEIGVSALPDSPAVYDPSSETIFVVEGLPESLNRFSMHRALTLALLDQEFDWSAMVSDVAPAVARGTRAFYDADALATAVGMESLAQRSDIVEEIFGLYVDLKIDLSPAPFASTVAGRLGVALRPYFESVAMTERSTLALQSPITDGQALDLRRLTGGASESPSATAQGMLFWYHALASRVDANTAWTAALAWQDDEYSLVQEAAGTCVLALIHVDQASLDSANAAFQTWAAAAPPESRTTVTVATDGSPTLQINACDPGPAVATNVGGLRLTLGGAPLRAEQFRILLESQPTVPAAQAACAVNGGDSVSWADERGVIEDENGWPAPANHPLPDPTRLGCAPV